MRQTGTKLKFSNGYNSVIFKVKIYEKISKPLELPREFKNAKIFRKKIGGIFVKFFENRRFLIIEKRYFLKSPIFKEF